MRLTVLGAGPAYTDREGATGASYLIQHGETHVLLDLGQGSLPRLFSVLPDADLDAVVISHLHPDHYIDLVPLRHYLRYHHQPPRRIRVLGPAELASRLDGLHAEPGFSAASLDTEQLGLEERTIGSVRVRAQLVRHTAESYAIRVAPAAGGTGIVYSGDCGRASDLVPLIEPGDVLLTEVSFGPGPVPADVAHLDGPAVGELASSTRTGRVLLTHLQMGFDPEETVASVTARYDGPVEFVWPGTSLEV
jgi:ribonuclease BN (tRNA processing enzyme)